MTCGDDKLSRRRQCELLAVNRSSYYCSPGKAASAEDLTIMNFMDRLYLEHPTHGVRKIRALLLREALVECIGLFKWQESCLRYSIPIKADSIARRSCPKQLKAMESR